MERTVSCVLLNSERRRAARIFLEGTRRAWLRNTGSEIGHGGGVGAGSEGGGVVEEVWSEAMPRGRGEARGNGVAAGEIRPLKRKRVGSGGARCGQKADVRKYRLGRAAVLSKRA